MQIRVHHVHIPAMSTVGEATGFDIDTGDEVTFGGDHRPLRVIGEVIEMATDDDDLPIVDIEAWQVLSMTTA